MFRDIWLSCVIKVVLESEQMDHVLNNLTCYNLFLSRQFFVLFEIEIT